MPTLQPLHAPRKRSLHVTELTPGTERSWFEFDRAAVLRQLDDINRAIAANAVELKMVAEEGVFERPLSGDLSRAARVLRSIAKDLTNLRKTVIRVDQYSQGSKKKS